MPLPSSNDGLCIPCVSLVGGGRLVMPHPELRRVEGSVAEELFQCLSCDAWWGLEKLGWARLMR